MTTKKGFLYVVETPAPLLRQCRKEDESCVSISSNGESKANASSRDVKKEQTKKLTSHTNNSNFSKLHKDIKARGWKVFLDLSGDSVVDDNNTNNNTARYNN